MKPLANLNGRLMDVDQALVPVTERGFLFGDAVYEVIRLYRGRMWCADQHFARLGRSLHEILIESVDLDRLRRSCTETIAAAAVGEGTVYIQVTRGSAPRTHSFPPPEVRPTELILVRPYDDAADADLRRRGAAAISYPDLRWGRRDIKSTNLLANVLANQAAVAAGCFEAVLFDPASGSITEGSHTSVFVGLGGRLFTAPESPEILPGITRWLVLHLARAIDLPVVQEHVTLDQARAADELILTGTGTEVLAVVSLDGSVVGRGVPGPMARALQAAYRQRVERWVTSAQEEPRAEDQAWNGF